MIDKRSISECIEMDLTYTLTRVMSQWSKENQCYLYGAKSLLRTKEHVAMVVNQSSERMRWILQTIKDDIHT